MNISKKVPVIVSIVLLVICVLGGLRSATRGTRTADPGFSISVKLTEDVRIVSVDKEISAALSGEHYDYTEIPAGTVGDAFITYSHRHSYIKDPDTDVLSFRTGFVSDGNHSDIYVSTGPESQLRPNGIHYKKIENYQEIIFEYNRLVKEEKNKWMLKLTLTILFSIAFAAVFSGVFWLECFIANKIRMHPGFFGLMCVIYIVLLMFALMFMSIF